MRRIGHRGAMGHAPENTIRSFQTAIALGCDEVETDVWLVDGRILVSHDRPPSAIGLSLDEVLDVCHGRVDVNVEVKSDGGPSAREAGAAVARHIATRGERSVTLSSFWLTALEGARAESRDLRLAFVFRRAVERGSLLKTARDLDLHALHPERAVATDVIAPAHKQGLAVSVWTVNDPGEIALFAAAGVDGIISDFPDRVPKEQPSIQRR
jgi:glycerophosphoryl diester phosphodiesterase